MRSGSRMGAVGFVAVGAATVVLSLSALAVEQLPSDRWQLPRVSGRETLADRAPVPPLPHQARLLGRYDWDRDGREELFAAWSAPLDDPREFDHHLLVLHAEAGAPAIVLREYLIRDGELMWVDFVVPPDGRDRIKVVVSMMGGSYWAKIYLLDSDLTAPVKLDDGTDYEFVDFNGDGVYEAVGWSRRPDETRCHFGMFGVRVKPTILGRHGRTFERVWPPEAAPWSEVMSQLVDVNNDGLPEVASLQYDGRQPSGPRRLAIYQITANAIELMAETRLQGPAVAFWLSVDGENRLELLTAPPRICDGWGNPPPTTRIGYEFRDRRLHPVR